MTRLETRRLILRQPRWSDADAVVELIGNFNVAKTLSRVPHPYTAGDAKDWLSKHLEPVEPNPDQVFAIELKQSRDHLIGVVGVHPDRSDVEPDETRAELGYWLGEPYWGQRLMSEAVRAVVGYVFAETPVECLEAGYFDGNEGSGRILTGLGFTHYGVERRRSEAVGEDIDCLMLRLRQADWVG